MNDFNTFAHAMMITTAERGRIETWEHRGLERERLGRNAMSPAPAVRGPSLLSRAAGLPKRLAVFVWNRLPQSVPGVDGATFGRVPHAGH